MSVRVIVVRAALALATLSLAQTAQAGVPSDSLCPKSNAAAAADCLRRLYFEGDYDDGHAEGAALVERFPGSPRLRAWLAANLAWDLREDSALAVTERMRARWPENAWTHFARALVSTRLLGDWPETMAEGRKARTLAPTERDMWWLDAYLTRLDEKPQAAVALIDSALARVGPSPELLVLQAAALREPARWAPRPDSTQLARGRALLQRALALDSTNAKSWSDWGAARYMDGDRESVRRDAERAVALAPRSLVLQANLLGATIIPNRLTVEQRRDSALAWYQRLRATRGESPPVLKLAMWAFRDLEADSAYDALEQRLLTRFPASIEAEWALAERPQRLLRDVYRRSVPDTLQALAEARRLLREFIARPVHRSTSLLGSAYYQLFYQVQYDSTVTDADMAQLVAGMTRYVRARAADTHVAGALALAERGMELPRAEQLARAAIQLIPSQMQMARQNFQTEGEFVDAVAKARAGASDALAWVYFKQGRKREASRLEARVLSTRRDHPLAFYHSARMAEAAGQRTRALDLYARGYEAERSDNHHPNEEALLRLHRAQHGSDAGYDSYISKLQEQERAHRRARILAGRLAQPRALTPFTLQRLGGGSVASDSLRGKVVVVNFWGIWCGPCVRELPQVQAVFERFRTDPDVVLLTIDNDPDVASVQRFLAQRKLTFPVLLDSGYVSKVHLQGFPTTWFIDRKGHIAFEQVGESDSVSEEAAWRIEALKAEAPVTLR